MHNNDLAKLGTTTPLMNTSATEGSHTCSSTAGYRYFLLRLDNVANTYQSHLIPTNTFRNSVNQFILTKYDGSQVVKVGYVDETHVTFHIVVDEGSSISGLNVKLLGIK